VGFTQLYPLFSSVRMRPTWRLNDLFVAREARGRGVARALMAAAEAHARSTGAAWVDLETETSNAAAQALYDGLGWARDTEHVYFSREVG
jgi:ribosomal protein S18 acetylase RimI-like enzyme